MKSALLPYTIAGVIVSVNVQLEEHRQKLAEAEKEQNSAQISGTLWYKCGMILLCITSN